MLFDIPVVF